MPVSATVARTVDQDKGAHALGDPRCLRGSKRVYVDSGDLEDVHKTLLDSGRFTQFENKQLSFPFNRSI
jgi:hypothetical protein